jgi:NitT/TauT family transport system substrate-binding protein
MKSLLWIFIAAVILVSCGQSEEVKKRLSAQEKAELKKQDSLALKVAVMPTFDCLPIFVAKERRMFDTLGVDVHLKLFTAQMDCDTAYAGGSVEGGVSDLVRALRLRGRGTSLDFVSATDAHWQLITNRNARLHEVKQLRDKMIAITRYSATDMLADKAIEGTKLNKEEVYRPQINDVNIRIKMLQNNEMDAMLLEEPQSSIARAARNKVLMDTRDEDLRLGVLVFRSKDMKDSRRQQQLKTFLKAYNMAVDSLNQLGLKAYKDVIQKYYPLDNATLYGICGIKIKKSALEKARERIEEAKRKAEEVRKARIDKKDKKGGKGKNKISEDVKDKKETEVDIAYKYKFSRIAAPRQADVLRAERWLKSKNIKTN